MTRTAVQGVLTIALLVTTGRAQDMPGVEGGTPPVGLQILSDPELFPNERDGDHALTRLARFAQLEVSRRNGHATTSVMGGYAPAIDVVVQKYGEPDRVVEEAKDIGMPPDLLYYWGDYGLAVRSWDAAKDVSWVRVLLPR